MGDLKYHIITYGCQMNLHDSENIAGALYELGYRQTNEQNEADIIVFNTCCIRENAENHAYGNIGALKNLKKQKKNLIIAVGGCMIQQKGAPEKLKNKFPFVDIIFGTHNLNNFKEMVIEKLSNKKQIIEVLDKEGCVIEGQFKKRTSYPNAWVNITYGCNNFCTYCIVPYVRGRERSRKLENIVDEVKSLVIEGYKEITLLGQNVNSYGSDMNYQITFSDLLRAITEIEGKFRIRFMTNHPKDLSEEMVKAMSESDKICKSVHLPVQAGSNRILNLMNRRYTREDYFEKIALLRKYIPNIQITTDIMVGFPTETEEDFSDTLDLVKKCNFSGAFTFVYSKRSGTKAAIMDGQIDEATKKDRIMRLVALVNEQNRKKSDFYKDEIIEILCEDFDNKKNMYLGRDEFGRMTYFESEKSFIGEFVKVKILKTGGISLVGELQ